MESSISEEKKAKIGRFALLLYENGNTEKGGLGWRVFNCCMG